LEIVSEFKRVAEKMVRVRLSPQCSPSTSGIIYPAVLAAWTFLALHAFGKMPNIGPLLFSQSSLPSPGFLSGG
jgi:hypothetical protein